MPRGCETPRRSTSDERGSAAVLFWPATDATMFIALTARTYPLRARAGTATAFPSVSIVAPRQPTGRWCARACLLGLNKERRLGGPCVEYVKIRSPPGPRSASPNGGKARGPKSVVQ